MENKKENVNQNKKVILAIIAIVMLLSVLLTTTYAFFTYTKAGQKNNLLVTGSIKLQFTEGTNNINLTNQFPMTDEEAMGYTPKDGESAITEFTVGGHAGANTSLSYKVSAIKGDAESGRVRMPDEHIKLYLTAVNTNSVGEYEINPVFGQGDDATKTYGGLISAGGADTDTKDGGVITLATGTVGTAETLHSYTLRMWISDTVTISDTDAVATYCASETECETTGKNIFSKMYYSLRLKVENY